MPGNHHCLRLARVYLTLAALILSNAFGQRQPTEASHGLVVSASLLASQVGCDILRKGGNAIDAGVATGLALAVTYPRAGNLGGGGFMVIHLADGRDVAIDYRETAPQAATRAMYIGKEGKAISRLSLVGHKATGIPGTVAGLALALEKYGSGKFTWAQLCEPARRLAAEGFSVPQGLANDLRLDEKLLEAFPETRRIYLRGGNPYVTGELFQQPDLAATFSRLQSAGPREFYEGETAKRIISEMSKNGGLIAEEDLKNYKAVERVPLHGHYRDYDIITVPPPSGGGIALLQMLAMLEPRDVKSLGHASSEKYHLFVEVMRRAYRDKAAYLGDPDFVKLPVAGMLDPAYSRSLMLNFDPNHATPSKDLAPGRPLGLVPEGKVGGQTASARESTETTQFSIVDPLGNAVSNTYTLNGFFGSGVTVPGTGFLLNNEMDDFASAPNSPNLFGLIQGEANSIAPGKRPLSSMTPTILTKDGKVFLVTGSPGGSTIINTVLLVITNVIDHGMTISQAVEQPRIHHQWMPDQITQEPNGLSEDVVKALEAKGHKIVTRNIYGEGPRIAHYRYYWGDAESIQIDAKTGILLGSTDPRSPDSGASGF